MDKEKFLVEVKEKLEAQVGNTVHLRINDGALISGTLTKWNMENEYVVDCTNFNSNHVTFADSFIGDGFYILVRFTPR